jgi:hypothetical protein
MIETDHKIVERHLLRFRGALDVFCEDVRELKSPPVMRLRIDIGAGRAGCIALIPASSGVSFLIDA